VCVCERESERVRERERGAFKREHGVPLRQLEQEETAAEVGAASRRLVSLQLNTNNDRTSRTTNKICCK